MKRSSKLLIGALAFVTSAAGAMLPTFPGSWQLADLDAQIRPRGEKGISLAMQSRIEQMLAARPDAGEPNESPFSRADQKIASLAIPLDDIPLGSLLAAEQAFTNAKNRGFVKGKGRKGSWISVGPTVPYVGSNPYRDTTVYLPARTTSSGRTVALAISPECTNKYCRLWAGAAGGGIWRTDKALGGTPTWKYLSTPFAINSIGGIAQDPNDPTGNTLWVGTGEPNGSGDSVHGRGLYKTTNGGDTWSGPYGESEFAGRGVGAIAIDPTDPDVIYAGSARAVNGVASVSGGGITITVPGAALWGLYKSTDGGATWSYIHNGAAAVCNVTASTLAANGTPCSGRGVRRVAIDPVDPDVVYAASFGRGIWRSGDAGLTWTQILTPQSTSTSNRSEFAVTLLSNGDTRMYVGDGTTARFLRSDSVRTGAPVFTTLSSSNKADTGYGAYAYCTGQCVYDNYVYTPPGEPDMVYLLGSFTYGENDPFGSDGWLSNGRGLVLSTDAGVSWTDQTYDATDLLYPNALHPDQHSIVTNPNNPYQFFESNDGGVYRSSGQLVDASAQCAWRALYDPVISGNPAYFATCEQLLSGIPSQLTSLNQNLTTLQFQSLSVNPFEPDDLQGGTQDNGTWESYTNPSKWINTDIGDGGQSGFDVGDPNLRFHTFYAPQIFVSDQSGDPLSWNWVSDFLGYGEGYAFYPPVTSDPVVSGQIFAGLWSVWYTRTYGFGGMSSADLTTHCNLWTGDFSVYCGDFLPAGLFGVDVCGFGGYPSDLTWTCYGLDRLSDYITAVERAPSDSKTVWAATTHGRVFVSKNIDEANYYDITWSRIDTLSSVDPGRFVTSIFVDPADENHAWISYAGFSASTPGQPGHIFEVTYDPTGGTATWTNIEGTLASGDLPLSDVAYDHLTGDLYVSSDYGVLLSTDGGATWGLAAPGMPAVEVTGLTIVPESRRLYAATHGMSAWRLNLP